MKMYIILISSLVLSHIAFSQSQQSEVQLLLETMISKGNVMGVSAGYSVNGKIVDQAAAGYSNKKSNIKFNLQTKVRMGSIAKPMTAVAVMQLVEQGLLNLDLPIQTYIPDYPKHEKTQITTRHLLSHTSGIPGYKNARESNTTKEYPTLYDALDLFKNKDLLFEPGTRYSYTTYGYTVLGVIIERISGTTYEKYMQDNIWNKAGMMHTGVERFNVAINNKSQLYTRNNGKGKAKLAIENNLSNRIPAGGFYTTLDDMFKFGNAILNNILIKEKTFDIMRQHHSLEKENNAYGFGWFLYNPKPNEGAIIGHPGAQTGCTSFLFLVPGKKTVSILLANTSRAQSDVDPVANTLLRLAIENAK